MKEKARLTKVKGTVLFTVVSVMMVLIVFLMGTLALAATANNRANRNYQKEQTEATARAVLDAVVEAINQDDKKAGGLADRIGSLATGSEINFDVTIDDGVSPKDYPVTITKTEERPFYADEKWQKGSVYSVSTTVRMTSTDVETVYTAYMSDADVNTGNGGGGGGGGGGGAFVSMGGVDEISTGSGYVTGGTSINVNGKSKGPFMLSQTTAVSAPLYVNGSLNTAANFHIEFNKAGKGQYIAVEGDWTLAGQTQIDANPNIKINDDLDYTQIPSIFVKGCLDMAGQQMIPTGFAKSGTDFTAALNVYCGSIISENSSNPLAFAGDIYCFDENGTSIFNSNSSKTLLYNWAKKTVTMPDGKSKKTLGGNLYSKGNVELTDYTFDGDIRVEGDLTLSGTVKAKTVVCNGVLTVNGTLECEKIQAVEIQNKGTINCSDISAFKAENVGTFTEYTGGSEIGVKESSYTLKNDEGFVDGYKAEYNYESNPKHVKLTYSYTVTTKEEEYGKTPETNTQVVTREEYIWDIPWDWKGTVQEYVENKYLIEESTIYQQIKNNASAGVISEPIMSYSLKDKNIEIYPDGFDEDSIRKNVIDPPEETNYSFDDTLDDLNGTTTIFDAGHNLMLPSYKNDIKGTTTNNGDSSDQPIRQSFILDEDVTKNLYIKPNKGETIVIYIKDNINIGNANINGGIEGVVIDDSEGQVNFFIGKDATVTLYKGGIWTQSYIDNYNTKSSATIKQVWDTEAETTKPWYYPEVYIYAEENNASASTPQIIQNDGGFLVANVRAPSLSFSAIADVGAKALDLTYVQPSDFGDVNLEFNTGTQKIDVVGQLICKNISVPQGWGMVYVSKESVKECKCGHCDGEDPATHVCDGTKCTSTCGCKCKNCPSKTIGGGSSSAAPAKLYTMYYNYY